MTRAEALEGLERAVRKMMGVAAGANYHAGARDDVLAWLDKLDHLPAAAAAPPPPKVTVVQVAACFNPEIQGLVSPPIAYTALCSDGSIWRRLGDGPAPWKQLPPVPGTAPAGGEG